MGGGASKNYDGEISQYQRLVKDLETERRNGSSTVESISRELEYQRKIRDLERENRQKSRETRAAERKITAENHTLSSELEKKRQEEWKIFWEEAESRKRHEEENLQRAKIEAIRYREQKERQKEQDEYKTYCRIFLESAKTGRLTQTQVSGFFNLDTKDKEGNSALHLATINGHYNTCRLLIAAHKRRNVPINSPGADGKSALFQAASSGNVEIFDLLFNTYLEQTISLDEKIKSGNNLVFAGVKSGSLAICRALMSGMKMQNLPTLIQNKFGNNPLHYAASLNKTELIKLLVKEYREHGLDIFEADNSGNTSLHFASAYGAFESCELLMKYGFNPYIKNNKKMDSTEVVLETENLSSKSKRAFIDLFGRYRTLHPLNNTFTKNSLQYRTEQKYSHPEEQVSFEQQEEEIKIREKESLRINEIIKLKPVDHHLVLGVSKSATQTELSEAHERLILKINPDSQVIPSSKRLFETAIEGINESFRIISLSLKNNPIISDQTTNLSSIPKTATRTTSSQKFSGSAIQKSRGGGSS